MEPAQSVVALLVRRPIASTGVPRWVLCRIGGTPLHAFPDGLDMADIKSHLAPLGIAVDEQGNVLMRPFDEEAVATP